MSVAIVTGLGTVIGVLLGLLGGGGAILAVPALVLLLGLGVEQAIPMSLIVVAAASATGVLPKIRAGQVQWRLALIFAAAGIPATFLGSLIGRQLSEPVILIGFAAVMVAAAVQMLRTEPQTGTACAVGESGINWRRCASRSIPAGIVVGVLTGLFGVGGGFLIIPALVLMLGIEMPVAVGTSLVIIVANSVAGIASHLSAIQIDWAITAAFTATAVLAAVAAGQLGTKLDHRRLQRWFGYLVLAVAAYVLIDQILIR